MTYGKSSNPLTSSTDLTYGQSRNLFQVIKSIKFSEQESCFLPADSWSLKGTTELHTFKLQMAKKKYYQCCNKVAIPRKIMLFEYIDKRSSSQVLHRVAAQPSFPGTEELGISTTIVKNYLPRSFMNAWDSCGR